MPGSLSREILAAAAILDRGSESVRAVVDAEENRFSRAPVPEGARARNTAPTTLPGPAQLGVQHGLGYASLAGWLELKLSSARQKDLGQVVEVLKGTDPAAVSVARGQIGQVHPTYLELLDQLLDKIQEERLQEEERKPPQV